jgi:hypothetical protein
MADCMSELSPQRDCACRALNRTYSLNFGHHLRVPKLHRFDEARLATLLPLQPVDLVKQISSSLKDLVRALLDLLHLHRFRHVWFRIVGTHRFASGATINAGIPHLEAARRARLGQLLLGTLLANTSPLRMPAAAYTFELVLADDI